MVDQIFSLCSKDSDVAEDALLMALHRKILLGDADARERVSAILLRDVVRSMRRRWRVDVHLIATAVEDAIRTYLTRPTNYDPARSTLRRYVSVIAGRRVIDELRVLKRRARRECSCVVESASNIQSPAPCQASVLSDVLETVLAFLPKAERQFVLRKVDGERRTAVLGRVLEISHLPVSEQRRIVNRTWTRLRKRIRAAIERTLVSRSLAHGTARLASVRSVGCGAGARRKV